jgi:hypothetical protein
MSSIGPFFHRSRAALENDIAQGKGLEPMRQRCGSYPFRYIADDFLLPYDLVLQYAELQHTGAGDPYILIREVVLRLPGFNDFAKFKARVATALGALNAQR